MPKFWTIGLSLVVGLAVGIGGSAGLSRMESQSKSAIAAMATMPSDGDGGGQQKSLWTCAMHPQVIEDHPGDCPICHMKLVPIRSDAAAVDSNLQRKILYWWDPMLGPSSIADKPGKSAMGMDRVPVYADAVSAGPAVTVDPAVVQNMGVRTALVQRKSLTVATRAFGMLVVPEPGVREISLKVGGWIDTLQADTEGMHVRAGQPLFELYSPDVMVAEEELIAAAHAEKAIDADAPAALRDQAKSMVQSAEQKLRLWDISDADIDAITSADHAPRTVTIRSPISGDVIDKSVVTGSAVTAGAKVMRIEDHTHLWLDAEVYANDFEGVEVGQTTEAAIEGLPGQTFTGTVDFIDPHVDHMTRTLIVRAAFENPDMTLRPGMYATATLIARPAQDTLLIPSEAVIDSGVEQLAFVADGQGHFEPRRLTVGRHGEDEVEVLSGLAPGEAVVTSGQFLLDVESNTKAAIARLQQTGSDADLMKPTLATPMATPMTTPVTTSAGMPTMPMGTPATTSMDMPMSSMTTTPTAPQPGQLSILHCPMKNADWLQSDDETHNPYLGTAMETCGSVTAHVPQTDDPHVAEAVDCYLKMAVELSRDELHGASAAALKVAVDQLDPTQAKSLRASVDVLARSTDLAAARTAFQAVSADFITLLRGGQR